MKLRSDTTRASIIHFKDFITQSDLQREEEMEGSGSGANDGSNRNDNDNDDRPLALMSRSAMSGGNGNRETQITPIPGHIAIGLPEVFTINHIFTGLDIYNFADTTTKHSPKKSWPMTKFRN